MTAKQQHKDPKTPKTPLIGDQDVTSELAALQAYGFKTMTGMSTAWMEALSDMGSEVLSFVADRIKEDVKTQHQMLHCKNVADLQHIQAEFLQTAIDQYTAETGKLVKMSQEIFKPPMDKD